MSDHSEKMRALEAALRVLEEEQEGAPFGKWLAKLLIEKVVVPVLVPALTAIATSICGWYFIGQTQLEGTAQDAGIRAAGVEVEKLEKARGMLEELEADAEALEPRALRPSLEHPRKINGGPLDDDEIDSRLEVLREEWSQRQTDKPSGLELDAVGKKLAEQREQFPEGYLRGKLNAKK